MTYLEVKAVIQAALTMRPVGTKVQVLSHEQAEIALLDFSDSAKSRSAHSQAVADINCDLVWNSPFSTDEYSFFVNGFDAQGNPCQITLISKDSSKITIQTFSDATIYAIANPY
jgi:hypothetical protein